MQDDEVLESFIKKYYLEMNNATKNIYVTPGPEDAGVLSKWISDIKKRSIKILVPKRGEKKKILDMVKRNASLYLDKKRFEKDMGFNRLYKELTSIKDILGLQNTPRRIECYDISNLGQGHPVGSMVVFNDGVALKEDYRHFRIKNTLGQNDYAMIQEIVGRRMNFLKPDTKTKKEDNESFLKKPDLIMIDGGKGQLNAASEEIGRKGIDDIDIISIAKKEEKVYCLKYGNGIKFDDDNNIIKLLTKIRDEAHRFAIGYHRKLRLKAMTQTVLDDIKGIGEKKKRYIFERVSTVKELGDMTLEELAKIKGITYKDALNIFKNLHR
jgi:excinuclease ABC subunit C